MSCIKETGVEASFANMSIAVQCKKTEYEYGVYHFSPDITGALSLKMHLNIAKEDLKKAVGDDATSKAAAKVQELTARLEQHNLKHFEKGIKPICAVEGASCEDGDASCGEE